MKVQRIGALLSSLALMASLLVVPASAAGTADGVYTAEMVTSYYNPDTGNVDDGGTANAALGEGMCRSATDDICLVEVDGDDIWITVRLLLQSNCSNVALYTRDGYDSYSQVSYDIMSEDAANDSIDYRIKVSDVGQRLKCTMYVTPMGRDVLWYLYVDTSTLTAGSGDFVVSLDPATDANSAAQQVEETSPTTQTPATSTTPADTHTSVSNTTEPSAPASETQEPGHETDTPPEETEVPGNEPSDEPGSPAEGDDPTQSESLEDTQNVEDLETSEPENQGNDTETEESTGGGVVSVVIGVVIVAAVVCIVYIVKRKVKR